MFDVKAKVSRSRASDSAKHPRGDSYSVVSPGDRSNESI